MAPSPGSSVKVPESLMGLLETPRTASGDKLCVESSVAFRMTGSLLRFFPIIVGFLELSNSESGAGDGKTGAGGGIRTHEGLRHRISPG